MRVHDLRHSCASALVAEGIHPKVISQILGHASIDITMDFYAHVFDETQRAATAQLDAHFSHTPDATEGGTEGENAS